MAEVMEPVPRATRGGHQENGRAPAATNTQSRPVAPEVQDLVNTLQDTNTTVSPSLDGFALPRRRNTGELGEDPGFQNLFGK